MRENHSIHAWHSQQGTAAIYFSSLRGGSHGQDLAELGKKVLKSERDFNKAAGFTARHDRLPRFMTLEPIAPHNVTFQVKDEDLDKVFNWQQRVVWMSFRGRDGSRALPFCWRRST